MTLSVTIDFPAHCGHTGSPYWGPPVGGVTSTSTPALTLTFDLLTLKSVWESHVTWGTPVKSFVFLGLLVFELEPMYATSDRRTPITA